MKKLPMASDAPRISGHNMSDHCDFLVGLLPRGKGSPRAFTIGKRAIITTQPQTREYMQTFAALALAHAPPAPFLGPIAVVLTFSFPYLASWPKWKREAAEQGLVPHDKKPDADNLQKAALDALTRTGRFWKDDAQIVEITARKQYADGVGTHVYVTPITEVTRETWAVRNDKERAVPWNWRSPNRARLDVKKEA